MSNGPLKVFSQTVATGVTGATITAVDFGDRGYHKVFLEIPTMSTGTTVYAKASTDNSNFRRVQFAAATSTVSYDWGVATAATNCFIEVPAYARYMKPELKTAVSNESMTFKWVCIG